MERKFITKKSTFKDKNTFNVEFWKKVSPEVKFAATWEMVSEVNLIRGEKDAGESRLQRSVQNIKRRKS